MMKKIVLLLMIICARLMSVAQQNNVEMADTMRSNGKIYVVVAVIVAIFAGIIIYLVRLDRKISKLERETKHNNS